MSNEVTILTADAVDGDNPDAMVALCHPLMRSTLNPAMVIVTGRHTGNRREEQALLVEATMRMCGMMEHFGYNVPVYSGLVPPATIIPPKRHMNDSLLNEVCWAVKSKPAGNFNDAMSHVQRLVRSGKRINWLGGGPYGEIAQLMHTFPGHSNLVVGQYGPYKDPSVTMRGTKKGFNAACDPKAATAVCFTQEADVVFATTELTKSNSVVFWSFEDIAKLGIDEKLLKWTRIYDEHVLATLNPRQPIAPHDVHTVFATAQLKGNPYCKGMYKFQEVRITRIGSSGELEEIEFGPALPGQKKRYVVTDVDASKFVKLFAKVCRKP